MDYLKGKEQSGGISVDTSALARDQCQPLVPTSDDCNLQCNADHQFSNDKLIEVGSLYEISNDLNLPPNLPPIPPRWMVQIKFIRVAMVSEITDIDVTVKFPSMNSLRKHSENSTRDTCPDLDVKVSLGIGMANELLLRQVPPQVCTERKHLLDFWLRGDSASQPFAPGNDLCLSELSGPFKLIEVGSIYEINHKTDIPHFIPVQIKFINVAMVSEKADWFVNVRFPSMRSLLRHFNSGTRDTCPDLDVQVDMGLDLASELLLRQVLPQVYEERKHLVDFWLLVNSDSQPFAPRDSLSWSEVSGPLKFLEGREAGNNMKSSGQGDEISKVNIEKDEEEEGGEESENDNGDEEIKQEGEKEIKQEDEKAEENSDEEDDATVEANTNQKRKRYSTSLITTTKKAKGAWDSIHIPEPLLKAEVHMRIRDRGMVDYLLENIDGELFPGGTKRYRRRSNAEGAVEYWLEDADLVNIRKEAGVNDPYWIPSPGWKPKECPTQQSFCTQKWPVTRRR